MSCIGTINKEVVDVLLWVATKGATKYFSFEGTPHKGLNPRRGNAFSSKDWGCGSRTMLIEDQIPHGFD